MTAVSEDLQRGFTAVPGGRVAHEIAGACNGGTPILLIRPLGGTMALWGPFRARLAETRRVLAFDYRGAGASSPAAAFTTTRRLAHDALCVLDELGVARAHVFGISLGGMVATWLAVLAPNRVERLVLASAPAWGLALSRAGLRRGRSLAACLVRPRAEIEACLVERILSPRFRVAHPAELRRIEALAAAAPTSRAALTKLALAGLLHDARDSLRHVVAPTLVLAGSDDELLGREPQRALAAGIRGAAFTVVDESGHDLTLEQPRVTAARVAAFLDAQPA